MLGRFTILATLAVLATAAPAGAATIVVDQAADSAASGGCAAADDDCSLRQAVTAAADGDTITIAADADPLITLGEIPVTKDVTIVGIGGRVDRAPAFDGTVIDANLTSRIFNVAAAAEVTLRDLLLVRGKAPDGVVPSPRGGENGGAVLSNGALRLERVTVVGSRAGNGIAGLPSGDGGSGGGVWASGPLSVVDSTFGPANGLPANRAGNGGDSGGPQSAGIGGSGGAIHAQGGLTMSGSTIVGNAAGLAGTGGTSPASGGRGGGVYIPGGGSSIVNSTFDGNQAGEDGGAIYLGTVAPMTVSSATITRNSAGGNGGGIALPGGATATLAATLLVDNTAGATGPACSGAIAGGADNLVEPADSGCPAAFTDADPWPTSGIPLLRDNGGPTDTLALPSDSPAIDHIPAPGGVCAAGEATDQNGRARPIDEACDSGAFEAFADVVLAWQASSADPVVATFPGTDQRGMTLRISSSGGQPVSATVHVDIPSGVTLHSFTAPAGTNFDQGTGIWTIDDVPPAGTMLTLTLSRTQPGDHSVVAEVTTQRIPDANPADNEQTLIVHEPVARYAVPGGVTTGACLTLATGCEVEYAVEKAAQEAETVFVAPGTHEPAPNASITVGKGTSLVGMHTGNKPLIRGDINDTVIAARNEGAGTRIADLEIENERPTGHAIGVDTVGSGQLLIERMLARAGGFPLIAGGATHARDSIFEALGPAPAVRVGASSNSQFTNVTMIGHGGGALLSTGGTHTLRNVIARDLGSPAGADIRSSGSGTTFTISNSNYETVTGTATVNDLGGHQTTLPEFVNPAPHGDFHQAANSVGTIDLGSDLDVSAADFEGTPRDAAHGPVDIGADELGRPPSVTISAVDLIGNTSGRANGTVKANGLAGSAHFEASTDPLFATDVRQFSAFDLNPSDDFGVSTFMLDLTRGTTYYVRLVAGSAGGEATSASVSFTTRNVTLTPDTKEFGSVLVDSDSADQTFTLSNPDAAAVSFDDPRLIDTDAGDFSIRRNTCSSPLAGGTSCEIDVDFRPVSQGTKSAMLFVETSAGDLTASLNGLGLAPATLELTGDLAFGVSRATLPANRNVTLTNTGDQVATITSIAIPEPFVMANELCPDSLAVGTSCTINIGVSGLAASNQAYSQTLTVASPDGDATLGATWTRLPDPIAEPTITGPEGPTNNDDPDWDASTDEIGATLLCALDSDTFTACPAGFAYTDLSEAEHTINVEVTGLDGMTAVATRTIVVDKVAAAPGVEGPTNPTLERSATFTFTGVEPGASLSCQFDTVARSCNGAFDDLALGDHTLVVTQTDPAGNTSPETTFTWTILAGPSNTVAPAIAGGPTRRPGVTLTSTAGTYAGTPPIAIERRWERCQDGTCAATGATGETYTLVAGDAGKTIRLTESATNEANDAFSLPPQETPSNSFGPVLATIAAPAVTVPALVASATVPLTITGEQGATFECKLDDAAAFAVCPAEALSGVADGTHTLTVRQTGADGAVGPPDMVTFEVDTGPPASPPGGGTIGSGPPASTPATTATFDLTPSEPGTTFLCSLDGSAFIACPDPVTFTGLTQGAHTFEVIEVDAAGNKGKATKFSWTVKAPSAGSPGPLPRATTCASRRVARITLRRGPTLQANFRGASIAAATLRDASGKVVRRLAFTRSRVTVDLRGMPRGVFTARLLVRLRGGKIATFTRAYRTCQSGGAAR